MITASTQTDEDDAVGSSSRGTPSALTTLVNTPTDHSLQVEADDSELQDAVDGQEVVLERRNGEEQMQEPSPSGDETTLEREEPREDLEQTQEEASGVRALLEAQAHPEGNGTADAQVAEAAGALQELAQAVPTPLVEEALLDTEKAAHEQTRAELTQLRADITGKNVELRRSGRLLREANASCEQLREENSYLLTQLDEADALISDNDDLQTQLDDAYDQISNFEVANGEQSDQITALQQQVEYLSDDVRGMMNTIRTGSKELKFFVQLGVQFYARLNRAEELLDGALGRSDRLMRSAAQRLSVYTPVDLYFRDTVVEEEEPTVQLAVEGATADPQAETDLGYEVMTDDADLEQLVNEVFDAQHGTATASGDVVEEIQDTEPVLSSVAPIATSSGTEPLFQPTPSPVEDEGGRGEEDDADGTAGPTLGSHETTRNQTPANQPNAPRTDFNAQNPIFGASARIFGAGVSAYPVPNDNMESGSFNFVTATDFNFGATTSFQAGSNPAKGGSKGFGVTDQEEPKEGPAKKTGTASIFEAAASANSSSSSADKEEEKSNKKIPSIFEAAVASSSLYGSKNEAAKKTKTTPIFDLSSLSSNNTTEPGASIDHDPEGASETPTFKFSGIFDFSKPAAEDEQGTEPVSVFGAGKSNQFSFSSSGSATTFDGFNGGSVGGSDAPLDPAPIRFGGKGKQKEEAMKEDAPSHPVPFQFKGKGKQKEEPSKKAANAPIFSAEAMARFDSPAPSKKAGFDRFDFGSAGAFKGQREASSSLFAVGRSVAGMEQDSVDEVVRDLEGDHESLYGYEQGYEPPQKRPTTTDTNPADAHEGDTMSSKPIQGFLDTDLSASPDSSQPVQSASTATAIPDTSTFGIDVVDREQGSVEVDGGNPVDDVVAGVSRIGSMPESTREGRVEAPPAAQEDFGAKSLSERQSSRGVDSAGQTETNEVGENIWQGRSRTAEAMMANWKAESRERAWPPTASMPWRQAEWPARLPPPAKPPPAATSAHSPAASTQAAVDNSGPNHDIEEDISSVMGAIEALSLGQTAPWAKMSDLHTTGIPFLSADWFARRYAYALRTTVPQRQVDGMEGEVQSETEPETRTEDSRVREDEQTPEQEPTSSEQPQRQAETSVHVPTPPIRPQPPESTGPQQNTSDLVAVLPTVDLQQQEEPSSAPPPLPPLPTITSTTSTTSTRTPPPTTDNEPRSQSQSQQTESPVALLSTAPVSPAAIGRESWWRSQYGTPRDQKGGLRLWSLRSERG